MSVEESNPYQYLLPEAIRSKADPIVSETIAPAQFLSHPPRLDLLQGASTYLSIIIIFSVFTYYSPATPSPPRYTLYGPNPNVSYL